ncbi:hypothetical protein MHYP_G00121730 [Metynnis hypsauchen]
MNCADSQQHRREYYRDLSTITTEEDNEENKTWEEAYEYCRAHYTGLAFLSSETQLNLAKKETKETQTVSVWTGLRFLVGEWLWVNGEPLGSRWGAWSHWPHFQQNPSIVELETPRWTSSYKSFNKQNSLTEEEFM